MTNQSPMYGAFGKHIQGLITPARRLSGSGPAPSPSAPTAPPPQPGSSAGPSAR